MKFFNELDLQNNNIINANIDVDNNNVSNIETDNFKSSALAESTDNVRNYNNSVDTKLTTEKFLQKTLQNIATPTNNNDVVNKKYVDDEIAKIKGEVMSFKGFVSTTAPTGTIQDGKYWYNSSTMPTTFPINVKVYNATTQTWSTETIEYNVSDLDLWANLNNNNGYYWFGNGWNVLDSEGDVRVDGITISKNINGELEIKDGGITLAKIDSNAIATSITNSNNTLPRTDAVYKELLNNTKSSFTKSYSNNKLDLTINLKNNNNTSKVNKTTTLLTKISDYTSLADSDKLSYLNITTQELKDVALSAVNSYIQGKISVSDGLTKDTNNVIKHSNNITAQTTKKIGIVSFDAQGHITGFSERPILSAVDGNSTDQQLISAKCFYDNSLLLEIYNIQDVLDLANSNFTINNKQSYNACCILKKDKSVGRLLLNFYADSSTKQTSAGWKTISSFNSNFPYKVHNPNNLTGASPGARNLCSMWNGSGYGNSAIQINMSGNVQMYYYSDLLNKTGGLNIALDIPITKK